MGAVIGPVLESDEAEEEVPGDDEAEVKTSALQVEKGDSDGSKAGNRSQRKKEIGERELR